MRFQSVDPALFDRLDGRAAENAHAVDQLREAVVLGEALAVAVVDLLGDHGDLE